MMEITTPQGFVWKDDSIFITLTEWLANDIDTAGYYRDTRVQFNPYKGKKAKVIAIEPLNDRYCAVRIAAWEEDKKEEVSA